MRGHDVFFNLNNYKLRYRVNNVQKFIDKMQSRFPELSYFVSICIKNVESLRNSSRVWP